MVYGVCIGGISIMVGVGIVVVGISIVVGVGIMVYVGISIRVFSLYNGRYDGRVCMVRMMEMGMYVCMYGRDEW